jgi:hypothetical protein
LQQQQQAKGFSIHIRNFKGFALGPTQAGLATAMYVGGAVLCCAVLCCAGQGRACRCRWPPGCCVCWPAPQYCLDAQL